MRSNRLENTKNSLNGITKLYVKWGQYSLIFTLICIVWLAWRVGTKPTRLYYPCSQFAIWQIRLFFGSTATPFVTICTKCISYIRHRQYDKLAGIILLVAILTGSFTFYQHYQNEQLRSRGSDTIPLSSSVIQPWVFMTELETEGQSFEFPETISTSQAVVSFNHDPSASYGIALAPYDPADNPAYDFVWETVDGLRLGSSSNPLDDLINGGDTVLIETNWVDFGPAVYTRPEVVRPLIDMAISAGATEIYIGDGGENVPLTENVISSANYSDMVSVLASRHPEITIEIVNLNSLSYGWHWINMSDNSSFAGSGYSHHDLGAGGGTLFENKYYQTSDNQSVNPGGYTLGWYAVNDRILDADVIINVPKMKTHQIMIATMSIKNLVGCTLASTYDEEISDPQKRIPHYHTDLGQYYFDNDIFWRAIQDVNKIILYADKEGVLQSTQQRRYLNVVDGIQAMERSQHHEYGGGGLPYDRHVILAGVDPAAVDAVGCRIMGYKYNIIPSIANADSDLIHPIGINDPDKIVIVGDDIDAEFNHVFVFNSAWEDDAWTYGLAITDFDSPTINSMERVGNTITANISDGQVAYMLYRMDEIDYIEKMSKDGDIYSAVIPDGVSEYQILTHDDYFNTAQGEPSTAPPTVITNAATSVGVNTATLNGTITDDGGDACEYRFEYDTDSGELYDYSTAWTGNITSGQSFSETITGLSQVTPYHFRAQSRNSAGTGSGSELTFTTTTEEIISMTVTDYGNDDVQFGVINPGEADHPADWGGSQGAVTITIGAETNVDVNVQLRGTDFSGPDTIDVSYVKYNDTDSLTGARILTDTYDTWYTVSQPLTTDNITQVYYWLSIPAGKAPGNYESNFFYRAVKLE
jgi:uncharacterized protein (DUF362 family)